MKVERYSIKAEETYTVFEFISEGPKEQSENLFNFKKQMKIIFIILLLGIKLMRRYNLTTLQFLTMLTVKRYWQQ